MHRWNPEIMGRGRWQRRTCLVVVVAGQQQLVAVVLHLVAEDIGGGMISTSRMKKG
jgi:hypothetical protein